MYDHNCGWYLIENKFKNSDLGLPWITIFQNRFVKKFKLIKYGHERRKCFLKNNFLLKYKISLYSWKHITYKCILWLIITLLHINWLLSCVLASPDLWKRLPLKCSITIVFTCPRLSWCKISSPFRENNNVVILQFHSASSCRWKTCGSSVFKDSFHS